jgi:hypothetical protein
MVFSMAAMNRSWCDQEKRLTTTRDKLTFKLFPFVNRNTTFAPVLWWLRLHLTTQASCK